MHPLHQVTSSCLDRPEFLSPEKADIDCPQVFIPYRLRVRRRSWDRTVTYPTRLLFDEKHLLVVAILNETLRRQQHAWFVVENGHSA